LLPVCWTFAARQASLCSRLVILVVEEARARKRLARELHMRWRGGEKDDNMKEEEDDDDERGRRR
jgi:hypothetical protein